MIKKIGTAVSLDTLNQLDVFDQMPGKITINCPTGDFFYDPWVIKTEYKDTAFETALRALPVNIGEARVIVMQRGTSYQCHADIDDRYHLTVKSSYSYLVDLENDKIYPTVANGEWQLMDAGRVHSAVVFGEFNRVQLVVRQLLAKSIIIDPVQIEIITHGDKARYIFDNTVSGWLNQANKTKIISNFEASSDRVKFIVESKYVCDLRKIIPSQFEIKIGDKIEY